MSGHETTFDQDPAAFWKARAEAAEAVIEKVRARVVSGLDEDVSDGGYGDGWYDALDEIETLVTP